MESFSLDGVCTFDRQSSLISQDFLGGKNFFLQLTRGRGNEPEKLNRKVLRRAIFSHIKSVGQLFICCQKKLSVHMSKESSDLSRLFSSSSMPFGSGEEP